LHPHSKIRTACLEEDDTDFFSFLIRIACCCEGRVRSPVKRRAEGAVWWEPGADAVCATSPSSGARKYLRWHPSKAACGWGQGDGTSSSPRSLTPSASGVPPTRGAKRAPLLSLRGQEQGHQSSQGRGTATTSTCIFSVVC